VGIKIIKQEIEHEEYEYHLEYESKNNESTYSLPCNSDGRLLKCQMSPCALANYEHCVNPVSNIICTGIKKYTSRHIEPAIARCCCGRSITLESSWSNSCENCGREYDKNGNQLAPRSQWGEETGEYFS
jgi:hypothetical protein